MKRRPMFGVLAAVGNALSSAVGVPFVNLLKNYTPGQLMLIRGSVTAALLLIFFRSSIQKPTPRLIVFAALLGIATIGFYQSIRMWGVNPTMVVITAIPMFSVAAKWIRTRSINWRAIGMLAILLTGVTIALEPWRIGLNITGLAWCLGSMTCASVSLEVLSSIRTTHPYQQTFWLGIATAIVGGLLWLIGPATPASSSTMNGWHLALLVGWGAIGGFLYYLTYVVTFDHLSTEVANVMVQGGTPAAICAAGLLLGERMSLVQWAGVLIAIFAVALLGVMEAKSSTPVVETA